MLHLSLEHRDGIVILKCVGKIVAGNGLVALHRTAMAQSAAGLVIDLQEVETLDAAGLGTLIRVRQWCEAQGMSLKLINPSKYVREVLALTALDSVLEVSPTDDDWQSLLREWACAES